MRAPIALTSGDPAGVGLELAQMAWQALGAETPFLLIADRRHLANLSKRVPVIEIIQPHDALEAAGDGLPLLHHEFPADNTPGTASPANAGAVIEVIRRAVDLVQTGRAAALCTNPINKKALKDGAGFAFPGHTEFLAHLSDSNRAVMMLSAPELSVVPVTIHIALDDVAKTLSQPLLRETIEITHAALKTMFGINSPRIAIAGLNPHAGEGGMMGSEEREVIAPVLRHLRDEGMTLLGPLAADTMFHAEARRAYDVAICMYHDQALIPIKTLNFHGGTNVTLGLPFIRTSPDHGTAFALAGKGTADPSSLIAALKQAANLAARQDETG